MTRPTLAEMAAEADALRALAYAYRRRLTDGSDAARARCLVAEREVMALGLCVFTPPAIDRIAEPERLGDILQREGLLATPVLDEGFVWEGEEEPSEIANVVGHTLQVRGPR